MVIFEWDEEEVIELEDILKKLDEIPEPWEEHPDTTPTKEDEEC